MTNFTKVDLYGTLCATPFFGLVFLVPGYCLGRVADVLAFRRRGPAEQWLMSMGISVATVPIAVNLLGRWFSIRVIVAIFWVFAGAACVDLFLRWQREGFPVRFTLRRSTAAALGLMALWAATCLVSLPDLQLGQRLYSTAAVQDLGVRSAFAASAMHGGAPPANPFFYSGAPVKLRYYYYWYVVTAIPGVAAGVAPRAAFFASSIWSGWLLAATVALFLKYFYGVRRRLRAACLLGMTLFGITGLDALCVLAIYLGNHVVVFDTEGWDSEQVTSWVGSLIWVPHHVAATAACMMGFVFLWQAARVHERSGRQRLLLAVLAALGFASAAGLSVYVTFAFAIFLVAAGLYWLATRRFQTVGLYAAVGLLVLLLSAGYLRDLRSAAVNARQAATVSGGNSQPPQQFAKLALRQLPPPLIPVLQRAVHGSRLLNIAARPFVLIPVMFAELGFFFLVAVRQGRRDWRERSLAASANPLVQDLCDIRWIGWLMLGAGLWVNLMMRSTVIFANDLSYRGVEVAQFILVIWGAVQLSGARPETETAAQIAEVSSVSPGANDAAPYPRIGWLAGSLLCLGLVSSIYQLGILRVYLWGSDRYGWRMDSLPQSELGGRTGAINQQVRTAFATLDRVLPATAKVQFGAAPKLDLQLLFYSRYQELDGMFPGCGADFGGSDAECARLSDRIAPIFGTSALPPTAGNPKWQTISEPTLQSADEVRSLCRDLGIDAIIVTGEDPVWSDLNGWTHSMKPVYAASFVAAYTCR